MSDGPTVQGCGVSFPPLVACFAYSICSYLPIHFLPTWCLLTNDLAMGVVRDDHKSKSTEIDYCHDSSRSVTHFSVGCDFFRPLGYHHRILSLVDCTTISIEKLKSNEDSTIPL